MASPSGEENLMNLANIAYQAGNFSEAEYYFTRALEINSFNPHAWLGKGLSAGWQSIPGKMRIRELHNALNQSLKSLSGEEYQVAIQGYVDMVLELFSHLAAAIDDYAVENACYPGVWEQYVNDMIEIIEATKLLAAAEIDPTGAYKLLSEVTRVLITGIGFEMPDGRLGDHRLPKDLRNELMQFREQLIIELSRLDPSFVPAKVESRNAYRALSFFNNLYIG